MQQRPDTLLEFPCEFPIKAMGLASADFDALVVSLIRQYVTDLSEAAVQTKASTNGKYLSVTVTFTARSREQLDAIYLALTAHERILMVF
ncbi:MAG: DUF493 domain-containing protein [Gammaproteobacteria bacterium]|nr:DUF493 domain-containing protein [Gammaproteobacteria bacterium]